MCNMNTKHHLNILMDKLHLNLPSCSLKLESFQKLPKICSTWSLWCKENEAQEGETAGNYNNSCDQSTSVSSINLVRVPPKLPRHHRKMPFRRRNWCGCIQNDEPPEICVVEGVLSLENLSPTQPMPSTEELEEKFAELVEELDLTEANKSQMMSLPSAKKWQIYCSRKIPVESADSIDGNSSSYNSNQEKTPNFYVDKLREITVQIQKVTSEDSPRHHELQSKIEQHTALCDGLKTALRTSAHSFVLKFIEHQGLPALLNMLEAITDVFVANSSLHTSLIGCIKALMNNSTGRSNVLQHPTSIDIIARSLACDNVKTKIAALEILGAVCLVQGGHKKVLDAFINFQEFASERARFQTIMNDLDRSTGSYRDETNLKLAIMSLINALVNYGAGEDQLEFRLHLRFEFIMLGIDKIIEKLRKYENETLDRHLDFFDMVRGEDEKELSRKFSNESIDAESAIEMFDLLKRKLNYSPAYPHFLSLLQHMLLLPFTGANTHHWVLFDRILQQIVLQQRETTRPSSDIENFFEKHMPTDGSNKPKTIDPDVTPLEIDVNKIVNLLVREEELTVARKRAEELERENLDFVAKLTKKEQELDLRTAEKEDLDTNLARMRDRLEKESTNHSQAVTRAINAEMRVEDLQHKLVNEQQERTRLEKLMAEGSFPDDQKAAGLQGNCNKNAKSPDAPKPPPAPIPMAPPMAPMCPPPPPPSNFGGPGIPPPPPKFDGPKKNIPQSAQPLKSFNWSKLPDMKVQGTVWSELDETKWYTSMDLESIDKLFSAYQKNGVANEGSSIEDLRLVGNKQKTKILSVIDGRRAQNCTILLSKLKMSDEEISKAILSMDSGDQLPIDMVEQLLKFTPSAEERVLLDEHSEDIDSLARADRFLYEISKIHHYEQRLRSLHYKKKFSVTLNDLLPRIASVMEASREVARSRRLRKLLELVLALGNYMNRGARGNAFGFRLQSLNRLADTKASSAKSKGTTLLHYLVQIIEAKFKDVLRLEEDMPHVKEASKVSLGEMDKDIGNLRTGMAEVAREIEFHRSAGATLPGDRFLPVMRDFHAQASIRFVELEDKFQDMKTRFDRAVRLFGEDGSVIQPEEFFGIFDTFSMAFTEARQDNENFRKRAEEEEKRLKQEAEMKKRTIERKSKDGFLNSMAKNLGLKPKDDQKTETVREFDDLIETLRTGDVFHGSEKYKRSRKTKGGTSPPRNQRSNGENSRERIY